MKHLFLLFGFLLAAFTAQAATITQKGVTPDNGAGLYYNLYDDGTAEIVRNPDYSSTYSMESLAIPATVTYNDVTYRVTTIATNAFLDSTIKRISGGANITTIGSTVFGSNSPLTSINLDGKVTSIGSNAFYGCASLTSIGNILDNVTELPNYIFQNCTALTGNITITAPITSIGEHVFNGCTDSNLSVSFTNLTDAVISQKAFYGFSGLKSVAGTVKSIGNSAFYNCTNFEKLELYNTTTLPTLGSSAFYNCTRLKSIEGTAASIGKEAFYGCTNLTSIGNLLDKVTNIPSKAFYNCSALTGYITLNAAITNIGESAFYNCTNRDLSLSFTNLTNATIGESAFSNNRYGDFTGLKSIAGTAKSIGEYAFNKCYNLTSIGNLLDNVTDIPNYAFYRCSALTGEITLNAGIKYIGEYAFIESRISNIYCLAATPPTLGNVALGENALSVKVPKSAVDAYQSSWETSYPNLHISAGDPESVTTAANSGSTTHWATFSNTYSDSELSVEAGKTLTLYNATVADGKLTLTERTGSSVAKGEAVLVKTDAETVSVTPLETTDFVKAEDNDLLATPEYATILHSQDGCKYYRLTYNNVADKTGLGFYLGVATVNEVTHTDGTYLNASPYKAYLKVTVEAATEPSAAAPARGFAFPGDDGETTGIECITVTDEGTGNNRVEGIIDLQGRKVSKPTKGVYINNGKKVIIK